MWSRGECEQKVGAGRRLMWSRGGCHEDVDVVKRWVWTRGGLVMLCVCVTAVNSLNLLSFHCFPPLLWDVFQCRSCSVLAQLYSTSTMEHHHFDHCTMILNSEVCAQPVL